MKTIGLVGGISWQSTAEYYRIINETIASRLGPGHSAKIILNSVDFGEVDEFIKSSDFKGLAEMITAAARSCEQGGAGIVLICANTMHFVARQVQSGINVPLLHIANVTIQKIREKGLVKAGLLGTKFTMEQDFYRHRFEKAGISILVPEEEDRDFIQQTIFTELFRAYLNPSSKERFLRIIHDLKERGAQGIILGCTEIPLLINQTDCDIPVFDTTAIHALAAADWSLSE